MKKSHCYYYNADNGIAPLYIGHEPIMLLLHQSAFYFCIKTQPNASIALTSTDYKTVALLLC